LIWTKGKINEQDISSNIHVCSCSDSIDEWITAAKTINSNCTIDYIIAFTDEDIVKAGQIASELGVDYYTQNTINNVNDKIMMRKVLRKYNLDDTKSAEVSSYDDIVSFSNEVGFPIIIKPRSKFGSIGVQKISSTEEIIPAYLRCKSESEESHIIVEEMIEGEEHSVEYYSENGIHQMIATSYYFSDPINRVEYGYLQDAILSRSMIEKIDTFMKSVLTALEINDGVTHTEFFITPEKNVRIVETHIRVAGDYTPEAVYSSKGVDLNKLSISNSIGIPQMAGLQRYLASFRSNEKWSCVRFLKHTVSGTLTHVEEIDDLLKIKGVEQITLLKTLGSQVRPPENSRDRLAVVRTLADTPELAVNIANETLKILQLRITIS
jgi:biotin carboxylase